MRSKDSWIQKAKALLFDCTFCVDSAKIKDEINALLEEGGGYDPRTESSRTYLRWPTKLVMCPAPGCWNRRIHHERPDEKRGPQYIEVPQNWEADKGIAFCSMECSMYSGLRSVNADGKKGWERFIEHFKDHCAIFYTEGEDLVLKMHSDPEGLCGWLYEYRDISEDSDKVREGMCWDILTQLQNLS